MRPVEILREFDRLDVRIDVRDGKVHCDAPEGIMTTERLGQLRAVKPHLIELLAEPPAYRKATSREQCARCRELERRGVTVLLCSICDVLQNAAKGTG